MTATEEEIREALEASSGEMPAPEESVFDRDTLIGQIVERLDAGPAEIMPGGRFEGKPVGEEFAHLLLADIYATLYEFRLTIDALQRNGLGGFTKLLGGGGRRRRRKE